MKTRNRACDQHAPTQTPYQRSLMKILPEVEARLYGQTEAKRGGSGPDANLNPDPRTKTNLDQKSRAVE
jgi:hypothetical protein